MKGRRKGRKERMVCHRGKSGVCTGGKLGTGTLVGMNIGEEMCVRTVCD